MAQANFKKRKLIYITFVGFFVNALFNVGFIGENFELLILLDETLPAVSFDVACFVEDVFTTVGFFAVSLLLVIFLLVSLLECSEVFFAETSDLCDTLLLVKCRETSLCETGACVTSLCVPVLLTVASFAGVLECVDDVLIDVDAFVTAVLLAGSVFCAVTGMCVAHVAGTIAADNNPAPTQPKSFLLNIVISHELQQSNRRNRCPAREIIGQDPPLA
jgi:hypothetical protein